MANLNLLDSGYVKPDNTGTQISTTYRANSGSTLSLKGVQFGVGSKSNLDTTPTLNNFKPADTNLGSIENDNIKITGILNTNDSDDLSKMFELSRMVKTVGYKFIYYNSILDADKYTKQLVYMMSKNETGTAHTFIDSEKTAYSLTENYRHIHVRFTSFDITQLAGNPTIKYTLSGVVLPFDTASQ